MSTLTKEAHEVDERYSRDLYYTRRQLGWLAWQRSSVGFSLAEEGEYRRLMTRETELLGLIG